MIIPWSLASSNTMPALPALAQLLVLLLPLAAGGPGAPVQPVQPAAQPWPYREKLAMVTRAVLPDVEGRLDHLVVDPVRNLVYVAALRNNTIEVLSLRELKTRQTVTDVSEPSGILITPDLLKLVVSSTGDRTVRVYSLDGAGRLTPERSVAYDDAPDAVRLSADASRVYVAHGSAMGSFDLKTGEKGPDVALPAKGEGFAIEPEGSRLFVNMPSLGRVAVVDRMKNAVVAEWPLTPEGAADGAAGPKGNYAMTLDAASGRLFVACRAPARVVVLDTSSGKVVGGLDCVGDADDCWFDAETSRVFVSGGGGSGGVTAVRCDPGDAYAIDFTVTTAPGARTSVLAPTQRRLYVAAPRLGGEPAFIFVYLIAPR